MNGLATIAPKLDPLIRRLASDRDGEIIACVHTIGRQLKRAGATWHNLADKLTSEPEPPADGHSSAVFNDYLIATEWILATDCGQLSARDIRFVESMHDILYRWPPSAKQATWLRAICEKLGGRLDD
jgi:hypothetical protein